MRSSLNGADLWSSTVSTTGSTISFTVGTISGSVRVPTMSYSATSGIVTTIYGGPMFVATGLVLDGLNDYLDVNLATVMIGGPMTIVAVLKWNSFNSYSPIFTCGNDQSNEQFVLRNVNVAPYCPSECQSCHGECYRWCSSSNYCGSSQEYQQTDCRGCVTQGKLGWSIFRGSSSKDADSSSNMDLETGNRYHIVATVSEETM